MLVFVFDIISAEYSSMGFTDETSEVSGLLMVEKNTNLPWEHLIPV